MRAILAISALVALTIACGGNTPTGPGTDTAAANVILSNGFMNARIDGTRWDAARLQAAVSTAGLPSPILNIGGTADSSATGVGILVTVPHAVGTHTIGATPALVMFQLAQNGSEALWAAFIAFGGSGSVTLITATATRAAGTFSFTAIELSGARGVPTQRRVTSGAFDVTF